MQPDDLALALGVHGHGDYRGNRDDAAALALFEVSRVEPQIRPVAGERAVEEGVHPLVDLLTELGDLRLADPGQTHSLHQIVDLSRRNAGDPRFLDHGDQRLLRHLPRLQERREVAPLPQLRDPQLETSQTRVEHTVTMAIAPSGAIATAFVAPGPDLAFDIRLHQQLITERCKCRFVKHFALANVAHADAGMIDHGNFPSLWSNASIDDVFQQGFLSM